MDETPSLVEYRTFLGNHHLSVWLPHLAVSWSGGHSHKLVKKESNSVSGGRVGGADEALSGAVISGLAK